jgi:sigma-B regulation protein RsbU (phosphoserine phosphatase)
MRAEDRVRAMPATALEESAEREGASARQLLQAQLHPLRSILDSLTDGVVIVDRAGRFLLESRGAERILGTGAGDVSPEDWPRVFGLFLPDTVTPYPPEDLPLARAVRGETAADVEIFVRGPGRPEGAWISVNGTPWRDTRGRLLGGIAVFREITAHKRADEATQRLSKAVEQTADNVMITDKDGRILYVNPAFENTTGYGLDEALGQTPRLLKSTRQDPRVFAEMWAALTAGRVFRGTLVNRRKSGVSYYAEQTVTPMRDGAGAITHFVSVARDVTELRKGAEREIELHLAGQVQQKFYPRAAPQVPGIDLAGAAYPCAVTSGDYYDYIRLPRERLGIVVGDVSGHGLGPALVMAETRASLRSCLQAHADLDEVLKRINATLLEDLQSQYFVTLLLAGLDVRARTLTYANAGHPTGYLLSPSGEIKSELESTRIPLGVLPVLRGAHHRTIAFEPGDLLVLLTDGILESRPHDGDFFGVERALALVREHRQEPARLILEKLFEGVRAFLRGEPHQDDLTAVICKIDPAS